MKSLVGTLNVGVSVVAAMLSNVAFADILYQNTTADLSTRFNTGLRQVGDQVILSGGAYSAAPLFVINEFSVSYYGLHFSGNETMQVRFYANDGVNWDGSNKTPGSLLWDSGAFSILPTSRSTLTFDSDLGKGIVVPKDFTYTVEFFGISPGEEAGVDLFGPPTVGGNYSDYWLKTEAGWVLAKSDTANIDFAASMNGIAVPEPTSLFLLGGLLLSAPAIWRKIR